ncbi:hypothetical protein AAFG07_33380 [Bradyrhizobium sp. B097]|uniref:hypothetical protein n=1 Tax=Bradyrhizobium sp. B097 TaxID=3140244 RepID=UPI003183BAEF
MIATHKALLVINTMSLLQVSVDASSLEKWPSDLSRWGIRNDAAVIFLPNFLHEFWQEFLYWDAELEN